MTARVVSLQVGRAGTLPWRGRDVRSAIVKEPVAGAVMLRHGGFDGDEQADLRVHGAPDKAACAYPVEHRARWAELLGGEPVPGAFGENLSVAGLLERDLHIGDVLELGAAIVQVSQPRGPCFKLAARWGRRMLPALMAREAISGFYVRVLEQGAVAGGDPVALVRRGSDVSVAEVMRVTYRDRDDPEGVAAVLAVPELAASWREALETLAARRGLPLRDFGTAG